MAEETFKEKQEELLESDSSQEIRFVGSEDSFEDPRIDLIGKVIEGRYEILSFIGEGGVGTVYKAKHLLLNKTIAIKFLIPSLVRDKRALQRFKTEAEITCSLSHQNIVTVREYGFSDGCPFLVMDYMEGKSLKDVISENEELTEKQIIEWILQVLDALEYAHSLGVIHRDIKPANIVFEELNDNLTAKILDFGIAKIIETEVELQSGVTRTGELFGTPTYMSPEQCSGKEVDTRSDIYSIGCVLFELIAKTPPFQGKSALEIFMKHINDPIPDVESTQFSSDLKTVIKKCLLKNPDDRYPSVGFLKQDLKCIHDGKKVSISFPSNRESKKILKIWMAVSAVLLIVAISTTTLYLSNSQNSNLTGWQGYVNDAKNATRQGKKKEASKLLEKALSIARAQKEPAEVRLQILYDLVDSYRRNMDYKSLVKTAREYVNLAYQIDAIRDSESMLFQLAHTEYQIGEFDNVVKDSQLLERSLLASRGESAPALITVYYLLGLAHYAKGDLVASEEALLKCVNKFNQIHIRGYDGTVGIAHWTLAQIYKKKNKLGKVHKHLKLASDSRAAILTIKGTTDIIEKRLLMLPVAEELNAVSEILNKN